MTHPLMTINGVEPDTEADALLALSLGTGDHPAAAFGSENPDATYRVEVTPADLPTALAAMADTLEQAGGRWWVCIDREFGDDVALGPYDDEHGALRDLTDGYAVAALCERDALDAYWTTDAPEPGRVLLHPDSTPHRPGDGYERTVLPEHTNDLGDWCPYSETTACTDGACPQGCTAADD